jgi:hypothetical protein
VNAQRVQNVQSAEHAIVSAIVIVDVTVTVTAEILVVTIVSHTVVVERLLQMANSWLAVKMLIVKWLYAKLGIAFKSV